MIISDRGGLPLKHFQQKLETVLRSEMRGNKMDRAVQTIP
jgi:hypothetical protein